LSFEREKHRLDCIPDIVYQNLVHAIVIALDEDGFLSPLTMSSFLNVIEKLFRCSRSVHDFLSLVSAIVEFCWERSCQREFIKEIYLKLLESVCKVQTLWFRALMENKTLFVPLVNMMIASLRSFKKYSPEMQSSFAAILNNIFCEWNPSVFPNLQVSELFRDMLMCMDAFSQFSGSQTLQWIAALSHLVWKFDDFHLELDVQVFPTIFKVLSFTRCAQITVSEIHDHALTDKEACLILVTGLIKKCCSRNFKFLLTFVYQVFSVISQNGSSDQILTFLQSFLEALKATKSSVDENAIYALLKVVHREENAIQHLCISILDRILDIGLKNLSSAIRVRIIDSLCSLFDSHIHSEYEILIFQWGGRIVESLSSDCVELDGCIKFVSMGFKFSFESLSSSDHSNLTIQALGNFLHNCDVFLRRNDQVLHRNVSIFSSWESWIVPLIFVVSTPSSSI